MVIILQLFLDLTWQIDCLLLLSAVHNLSPLHQGTEVMTGARFLSKHSVASVSLLLTDSLAAMVRAWHQAWQEALGPAGKALTTPASGWSIGPSRPQAVAPGSPHCCLQELVSAMIQRDRELQVHAVEHHGVWVGLWEKAQETKKSINLL